MKPEHYGTPEVVSASTGTAKISFRWRPLLGAAQCLCHLKDHFDLDGDAKGQGLHSHCRACMPA
jgi:hypothetical protein